MTIKSATVKTTPERKLVAVVGDSGFWYTNEKGAIYWVSFSAGAATSSGKLDLNQLLDGTSRKPVYEGDTVTLQF